MYSWLDGLVRCGCCGNTLSISRYGEERYYNNCRMDNGNIEQLSVLPSKTEQAVLEVLCSHSDKSFRDKWESLSDEERSEKAKSLIKRILVFDSEKHSFSEKHSILEIILAEGEDVILSVGKSE